MDEASLIDQSITPSIYIERNETSSFKELTVPNA